MPIIRRLCTAPGIGPVRAAQIVASVITPHRFRTKQQFWSYCGFGVKTEVSSEWDQDTAGHWYRDKKPQPRGLNRCRNAMLKNVFKGAAMTVATRPGHALYPVYAYQLQKGVKPPNARLTLARQLCAAVLRMWKNKEGFDTDLFLRSHQT